MVILLTSVVINLDLIPSKDISGQFIGISLTIVMSTNPFSTSHHSVTSVLTFGVKIIGYSNWTS